MVKLRYILLYLFVFFAIKGYSQVDREFWFAIPKETSSHGTISAAFAVSFKISAMDLDANVVISMPANPFFVPRNLFIPAGTSHIEVMATTWVQFDSIYANPTRWNAVAGSGKTLHGILISSDNDITVYYDYDNQWNRDLFSLKGKNSLGTEFFTPFQNIWSNGTGYTYLPYSDISVVATEDGTIVDFYPTQRVFGFPWPLTTPSIQVVLNRGETYTIRAFGNTGPAHLSGTRIVSNKKIAVTINDDSVQETGNTCRDILGDQLVPTDIIGSKYLVMSGYEADKLAGIQPLPPKYPSNVGEQVFVTATRANTTIEFKNKAGTVIYSCLLNAGQSDYITIDIDDPQMSSIYISSDHESKPFYVFHITGITCELGGAILPPITDCTGSNEVTVFPGITGANASGSDSKVTLNIMVPYDNTKPFNDPSQSHNHFILYNTTYPAGYVLPGTFFEPDPTAGWAVLKFNDRNFGPAGTNAKNLLVFGANKFVNTEDFFHLGMTNGSNGRTNKYGYFSSFNQATAQARIVSTESQDYIGCFGQRIRLVAKGGLEYTWRYGAPNGPFKYLSDYKSSTPEVTPDCPPGSHNFYVTVRQAKCFGDVTLKVNVVILPKVTAYFEPDKGAVCSPDSIRLTNMSINAQTFEWIKQINNNPKFVVSNTKNFRELLDNLSTTLADSITYTLIAHSNQGCSDMYTRSIKVFPRINAYFAKTDSIGCNPLTVSFTNQTIGNKADSLYRWDFGDQGSSNQVNPTHTFTNFTSKDTTYNITFIAKSPFYCTDTARSTITVHPYIFANYATDTVQGCSPLQLKIQNGSLGAISRYKWEYGNGDTANLSSVNHIYTYRNRGIIDSVFRLKLSVFNAAGCIDSMSRIITAFPEIQTRFTADIDTGCTPMLVTFNNLSNAAADSFYWNFGDGTSSYLKHPQKEYINRGINDTVFKVTLLAATRHRCPGHDSAFLLVRGFIEPRFSLDTSNVCAPFNMTIINQSIHHPSAILSWNFGDGSPDTITASRQFIHRYRNTTIIPLNLDMRLNITNITGDCSKTLTKPVRIFPEIIADFTPDTAGCNPLPVQFRNLSTDQVAKHFTWDFGDSASSVLKNPFHEYSHIEPVDQTYRVRLIAQSDYNCRDTAYQNITVYSYFEPKFTLTPGQGCSPLLVALTDSSWGDTAFKTFFAGGTPILGDTLVRFVNTSDTVQIREIRQIVSNLRCSKNFTRNVIVFPEVRATYSVNDTIGCNPFNVNFEATGNINIISKYRWEFGDYSSSSTTDKATHQFTNYQSIEIPFKTKLVVQSSFNCKDSSEKTIWVYPYIKANFSIDNATGCSPRTIRFENASSDAANTFTWIYNDGSPNSSTGSKFHNHEYRNPDPAPRTFHPTLIASYNGRCQDDATQNVEVYPEVTAAFTQDTLQGCHPLAINFINGSSNAHRFNWSFGDKGTALTRDAVHTYVNFSNVDSLYTVKLVAKSEFNCEHSVSKTVTIFPKPKARFYVDNSINCPPFLVPIENLSEAADTFIWTFGDGSFETNTNLGFITHTYDNFTNNIYTYDLDLFAKTVHNCYDRSSQSINVYPRVFADFSPDTAGCSPFLVPFKNVSVRAENYIWNFDDGNHSKIQSPTHNFFNHSLYDTIFDVSMIGISKFECSDTAQRQVTVYPQPEARFIALPTHMEFPISTVNVLNQTNAGFWDYLWNFDDGNTSSLRDPGSHTYSTWGEYYVSLIARSNRCADTATQRVRVFAAKPVAKFVASTDGCVPVEIQFTDSSKYATSWFWEFDDGGTSREQNPRHTYIKAGKYQVKLTITGDGGTDFTYQQVNIFTKPEVDFTHNPTLVMLPDSSLNPENKERGWVQFTNKSKHGTRFLWDFGDGGSSTEENVLYQYKEVGTYDITLNVWTINGCFDSIIHPKAIKVMVRKDIRFPNAFTPNPNGPNGGVYSLNDISNDVFHPHWTGVVQFKMEIYDRWGEKLFESNDINIGWDGYYKGKLCKSDVYVCKASGKYADGVTFNYVGDITLIR